MTDEEGPTRGSAYIAQMLTAASPESMKLGFTTMIDGLIEQADDVIIDWGTSIIQTNRVLDPDDGAEMIYFQMSVHILDLREDLDD